MISSTQAALQISESLNSSNDTNDETDGINYVPNQILGADDITDYNRSRREK